MKKIYLCDFNDSFTYNIYSTLEKIKAHHEFEIEVISTARTLVFLQTIASESSKCAVILGPGPGHPKEYSQLHLPISKIIENPNIFVLGICLGHQLILSTYGLECTHCIKPIHGSVAHYTIENSLSRKARLPQKLSVQRYNSLAIKENQTLVKKLKDEGWSFHIDKSEIIICYFNNTLSFQFHPESIGTTCPEKFFTLMLEFLL